MTIEPQGSSSSKKKQQQQSVSPMYTAPDGYDDNAINEMRIEGGSAGALLEGEESSSVSGNESKRDAASLFNLVKRRLW